MSKSYCDKIKAAFWPIQAIFLWCASWALFAAAGVYGVGIASSGIISFVFLLLCAFLFKSNNKRFFLVAGFAASTAIYGTGINAPTPLPSSIWLAALLLAALTYPPFIWSDAPFFPTPERSLSQISSIIDLPRGSLILDAGCGMGHGLMALRRVFPDAAYHGVERSWLLGLVCRLWRPWSTVYLGDMWKIKWNDYDLIYLFQRPDTMNQAIQKAQEDLKDGAWVVSFEFPASGYPHFAKIVSESGKIIWIYKMSITPP